MVNSTGTSFIPKKNVVSKQEKGNRSVSLVLFFAMMIFIITVLAAGWVFFYNSYLSGTIENSKNSLNVEKKNFEFSTIQRFTRLNKRITSSEELLSNHIDLTGLFELLEAETLKAIQFESLDFKLEEGGAKIAMKGIARSYSAVALQSDVFGDNNMIKNPVFSNLDVNNSGDVVFDFVADIDEELILYKNRIK